MKNVLRCLPVLLFFISCSAFCGDDLNFSMREWAGKDPAYKLQLITAMIQSVKRQQITLRLPPDYYVTELDKLAKNEVAHGDPVALDSSWAFSWKTIAVMDCDWDNDQDRLKFAQDFLGPDYFTRFKKDYPDKYQRLVKGCPSAGG